MALSHAQPGQVVDVSPRGARIAGEKTSALFKARDLEVMHLVLPAGKALPPHKVPGEITIHCLEGVLRVTAQGVPRELRAGQLLYLEGDALHDVTALADATALVTIALAPAR